MNVSTPDLLTLVDWAQRLAAGERCAPWEAWCASSSDAARTWARVIEAREFLAAGGAKVAEEPEISAEDLSQFVEGRLDPVDARRVEQACWRSIAQLAELLSAAQFMNQQVTGAVSPQLEARLLSLFAPLKNQNGSGKPFKFRLSTVLAEQKPGDPDDAAPGPTMVAVPARKTASRRKLENAWLWPLAGAALLLVVILSGTIGFLAATWRHSPSVPQPIAKGLPADRIVPQPITPQQPPDEPTPRSPKSSAEPPRSITPRELEPQGRSFVPTPGSEAEGTKATPRRDESPSGLKLRPHLAPPTPEVAIRSLQGVLLVDVGHRGRWRVAPASYSLREPLKILSLAESWTTGELLGIGTLIWEGNSESELTTRADGTIELRLIHGRLGIQDLKAEAQIWLLAGDAAWTIRGTAKDSTLAIVSDPISPGLLVVRGGVEADGVEITGGQVSRWIETAPQPPQPIDALNAASASQQSLTPPAMNPWDLTWLQPPDDNSRKQWRTLYGKLVERLAAVDDAGEELPKLLATTREPRQAALLARWNVAAASGAAKPQKTWELLADRRAAVRVAGVKSMLELPPGDERLSEMGRLLIANVGPATADRINQWHAAAWQPGAPPKAQADEIIEHLQHKDLAVRQFAVSFLELYTANAFQKMGLTPPAYDPTATSARRTAAQMEWSAIIQQLYNPNQKIPGALTPRQALQNALQNGS